MAQRELMDPEADGWEKTDFPIVCETCLGPNPYVRMQRIEYGGTCHISGRPYTVFRWRPGNDARYKKTIICQEVAKAKNVCQVCLLDLDYNLPVQVRDKALGVQEDQALPESVAGKEFALNRMETGGELDDRTRFNASGPNELLNKLARPDPNYKRNQARVCSFFARGECKRGTECPYRHELPTSGPLSKQNIKDRYYGTNDPVAEAMLKKAADAKKLTPPEDRSITTLFVGGVGPSISEDDMRDAFYAHGELKAVKKVEARNCAFVTFATRTAAEKAAEALAGQLVVKGERLKLMWGKPAAGNNNKDSKGAGGNALENSNNNNNKSREFATLPGSQGDVAKMYPSMDPLQAGAPDTTAANKRSSAEDDEEPTKKKNKITTTE